MRCPTLSELPPPPSGKTGWPWTEENPQLPDTLPDGSDLPRISIVTPNYNYGQFLETTIRSILLQGYPNLEYIIIDGGSTDNSLNIIKKYEPWLSFWTSEPDSGQADAINKGFLKSTGDVIAFLNSDDVYQPTALAKVGESFSHSSVQWLCGTCDVIDGDGKFLYNMPPSPFRSNVDWVVGLWFPQPSVFWRRCLIQKVGLLDRNLHYCLDQEYWARLACNGYEPVIVEKPLAIHRHHPISKTGADNDIKIILERLQIAHQYMTVLELSECKQVRRVIHSHERNLIRKSILANARENPALVRYQLLLAILHHPDLLLDRATWGAFRQFSFLDSWLRPRKSFQLQ